jgi:hypothetical protein
MKTTAVWMIVGLLGVSAMAGEKTVIVPAGDVPGFTLTVPDASKFEASKHEALIRTKEMALVIQHLPDVAKIGDAVPRAAEIMKGEFLKFQATRTNDLSIAGAPAKELAGTGEEADDGDPGTADILFFAVGKNIYAAYVHGEHNPAEKQREPMLQVLKTVKAP